MGALEESKSLSDEIPSPARDHRHCVSTHTLQEHGKEYSSDEEELLRHITWEANKKYVVNHNEHADLFGFTVAMNKFADMVDTQYI